MSVGASLLVQLTPNLYTGSFSNDKWSLTTPQGNRNDLGTLLWNCIKPKVAYVHVDTPQQISDKYAPVYIYTTAHKNECSVLS